VIFVKREIIGLFIIGSFGFPALLYISDAASGGQYWTSYPALLEYLPAYIATVLGVFIGLSSEGIFRDRQTSKRLDEMKIVLKDELERTVSYLAPQKGNYLQVQAWDSFINSGDSALLEPKLQRELFKIYDQIKNLNIDVQSEAAAEQASQMDPANIDKFQHHAELDRRNRLKEHNLSEVIKKLIASKVLDSTEG